MILRAAALVLLVCGSASGLSAQAALASLSPSAEIVSPITGGGARDLYFGVVAVGGSADTGPGAEAPLGSTTTAKWEFNGLKKGRTVTLSFTLPGTLTQGSAALPANWNHGGYGTWCSRIAPAAVTTCGGAGTLTGSFNPQTANGGGSVNATTVGGAGNNNRLLTVWVGGTLGPVPVGSPPGLYTGTLRLTIVVN